MTLPQEPEKILSEISSMIAIVAFCYAIVAYFINNRRKSKTHTRKIRDILVVKINRDNKLCINEALCSDYKEIKEKDVRDIVDKFDSDQELFEKLPGVYEDLVEYLDLVDEVLFMRHLEKTTVISTIILFLLVALMYAN